MEDTIIQLQELVSHQGEDISKLSDAIYAQQKEINSLNKKIQKLEMKLESDLQDPKDSSYLPEPPPPHY